MTSSPAANMSNGAEMDHRTEVSVSLDLLHVSVALYRLPHKLVPSSSIDKGCRLVPKWIECTCSMFDRQLTYQMLDSP